MMKLVRRSVMMVIAATGVAALTGSAQPPVAPRAPRVVTHDWKVVKPVPLLPVTGTDPTGGGAVVGPCTPVPGCACAEVQVVCGDTEGEQYAGSTEGCVITLDPAVCTRLGITPVASTLERVDYLPINPSCWLDPINAIPSFTGIEQVEAYCTAQHEARHACADASLGERCAKEHNAYEQTLACLGRIWDAKCNELGPGAQAGYCDDLRTSIGAYQGISALEQCLCESSSTCDECVAACEDVGIGLAGPNDQGTIVANCEGYGYEHACAADLRP